jgi:hypothetical protein
VRGYGAVAGPLPTGNGIGVEGKSGNSGIGVLAENTGTGLGLAVKGRAGFSACGSDTITAGQVSKTVNNPSVTTASHITVTLTENPGSTDTNPPGQGGARAPSPVAQVHWIERRAGSFTIHLTQAVVNATAFTYLVVEPYSGSEVRAWMRGEQTPEIMLRSLVFCCATRGWRVTAWSRLITSEG